MYWLCSDAAPFSDQAYFSVEKRTWWQGREDPSSLERPRACDHPVTSSLARPRARPPEAEPGLQDAQAALRGAWERPEPLDSPGRPRGRCRQTGGRPLSTQLEAQHHAHRPQVHLRRVWRRRQGRSARAGSARVAPPLGNKIRAAGPPPARSRAWTAFRAPAGGKGRMLIFGAGGGGPAEPTAGVRAAQAALWAA